MSQKINLHFTKKQKEAFSVLHSDASNILLYGGARSGKSFVILCEMVFTALQFPGSRQLAGRLHLTDAIASLWNETLKGILSELPLETYKINETQHKITFYNGSEIYVAGFDDKERTEKILGREFCRIYLNECSQIPYRTVTLVKTRLAQKVQGLENKTILDENPPSPSHWTYRLFIEKIDPLTLKPLSNPEDYASLKMNPVDNKHHLSKDFLKNLESLPEDERKRFLDGEFVKPKGVVFDCFNRETMAIPEKEIPDCDYYAVGIDLGNTSAAVLVGFWKDKVYVIGEIYEEKITASTLNQLIEQNWSEYPYVAYIDHNWSEAVLQEFSNSVSATKGKDSVEAGINLILQTIENDNFRVSQDCAMVLHQLEHYRRNPSGRVVKEEDHALDAMRYAIFSEKQQSQSLVEMV